MEHLVDRMIRKRLCLSYNADINRMREEKINDNVCDCGSYKHISCIFKGNLKGRSCFQSVIIWNEFT
jgi:hypothetical protein